MAGVGGYLWWKKLVYGELSFYRTANGAFSILRAGQDIHTDGGVAAVQNWNNPYWRVALSHDWGANSVMIGTYGMIVNRYPSNFDTSTATDRYRDIAVDAQYQYITDPHTFTAQATYINERQSYNASYAAVQETGAGIGRHRRGSTDTLSRRSGRGHVFPVGNTAHAYFSDQTRHGGPTAPMTATPARPATASP